MSALDRRWQALKKHLKTLKKQFNIPFVKKNTKNVFWMWYPHPPDNDPGCYSEITPEGKKILIKMFVFLEKNLYLDAIGLHLK